MWKRYVNFKCFLEKLKITYKYDFKKEFCHEKNISIIIFNEINY